jgi:hypothetical protein
MPVRIYDLAKKLGIESKLVLVKAKELGMSAAKVPSSSLDKITAEFLELELTKIYPQTPSPEVAPTIAAAPVAPPAPITIISEPAPEPAVSPAPVEAEEAPVETLAPAPVVEAVEAAAPAPPAAPVAKVELPPSAKPAEIPPPPPPVPPAPRLPRLGEKVGFVVLPARPAPRPAPEKPFARGLGGAKTDFVRRGDIRSVRPGAAGSGAPSLPGQRLGQRPAQRGSAVPATPKPGKFVPPTSGEIITLKPPIIVRDLAEQLKRKPFQLIADLSTSPLRRRWRKRFAPSTIIVLKWKNGSGAAAPTLRSRRWNWTSRTSRKT